LAGGLLAVTCVIFRIFGAEGMSEHAGLIAFGYAWGGCDLTRRIALSANKVVLSTMLSAAAFVCVVAGLFAAHSSGRVEIVWGVSFAGVAFAVCVVGALLRRGDLLHWEGVESLRSYAVTTMKDSVTTIASFGLAWLATQGLFASFYSGMEKAQFIETKWAFSALGIFGIAISVQENRFQPAISGALHRAEESRLATLLDKLNRENVLIGFVAVAAIAAVAWIRPGLGLSTCALLLVYRQCFALSKTGVYLLRAHGRFSTIMTFNAIACGVGYASASLAARLGANGIAWGLAAYGVGMYSMISWRSKTLTRLLK
jgi:hypothetical protein